MRGCPKNFTEWTRRSFLPSRGVSSNISRQSPPSTGVPGRFIRFSPGATESLLEGSQPLSIARTTNATGTKPASSVFSIARTTLNWRVRFSARQQRFFAREEWKSVRGPYSPSINDECGLLVEGFQYPPCLGLCWNPEYQKTLIEQLGFQRR